ncbi:MAG: hypothetical protein U0168_16405 [Nannocystaceae bacterium]
MAWWRSCCSTTTRPPSPLQTARATSPRARPTSQRRPARPIRPKDEPSGPKLAEVKPETPQTPEVKPQTPEVKPETPQTPETKPETPETKPETPVKPEPKTTPDKPKPKAPKEEIKKTLSEDDIAKGIAKAAGGVKACKGPLPIKITVRYQITKDGHAKVKKVEKSGGGSLSEDTQACVKQAVESKAKFPKNDDLKLPTYTF